jgi:hypothetical protein
LRLIFLFPSGDKVERQVRHALSESGGAVKQSTCGTLEDVPVPRKISSIADPELDDMARNDSFEERRRSLKTLDERTYEPFNMVKVDVPVKKIYIYTLETFVDPDFTVLYSLQL